LTRKHPRRYDKTAYKGRNVIKRMFCRLKDFRRIATRYDKRADAFLSAILLAAAISGPPIVPSIMRCAAQRAQFDRLASGSINLHDMPCQSAIVAPKS
jgi:hypothetical protein